MNIIRAKDKNIRMKKLNEVYTEDKTDNSRKKERNGTRQGGKRNKERKN